MYADICLHSYSAPRYLMQTFFACRRLFFARRHFLHADIFFHCTPTVLHDTSCMCVYSCLYRWHSSAYGGAQVDWYSSVFVFSLCWCMYTFPSGTERFLCVFLVRCVEFSPCLLPTEVQSMYIGMGWLLLVGSLKLQVSFAKEPCKRDDILQQRLIISRSLQIVATP